MHETDATITTSRRRSREDVAAWRNRSMSSLREEARIKRLPPAEKRRLSDTTANV